MSGVANKVADIAHKTCIVGLLGSFGFLSYQVVRNAYHGVNRDNLKLNPQEEYINTIREKVKEDREKHKDPNYRDWYDKDDDSYLNDIPKPSSAHPK
jgi:hypothetical protein